jgi:site-specific recombinase XerD
VRDMRKFARWWFSTANHEPFTVTRVTVRDITDFRGHLRQNLVQQVSTTNRAFVTVRRFFGWLAEKGHLPANPAKSVKFPECPTPGATPWNACGRFLRTIPTAWPTRRRRSGR